MASANESKKMRILLIPFFATSHIGPHTDLAVRLATARPGCVEPSIAVTPANVSVVRWALERHGPAASGAVKIVTYPFPRVAGLAPGVENLSTAGADAWRIDAAAFDEALVRPAQEALLRSSSSLDAVVTDFQFFWNSGIAAEPGLPCVVFSVINSFSVLVMRLLVSGAGVGSSVDDVAAVPGLPGPEIRIPVSKLPEFLRRPANAADHGAYHRCNAARAACLGVAVNTYVRVGALKRCYFVGPVSLPLPAAGGTGGPSPCISWLESGSGRRSTRYEERELVPAEAVARAVARFLEPGGPGEASRARARDLAVKAHAAVAEGGSSSRDLHRLIDDLIEARVI